MAKEAKDTGKGKKAAPSPDSVMPMQEMRSRLKLAKNGKPMGVAICLSAENEGIIYIDKKARGRKLRTLLIKKADEAELEIDEKSIRFGRASVSAADETLLLLTVNKKPSGSMLHAQLKRRVKPANFSDVLISENASVEDDQDEEEDAPAAAAAVPNREAAAGPASPSTPAATAAPPPTSPAAAQPTAQLAGQPAAQPAIAAANPMAGPAKQLGELIARIKEAPADQKGFLSKLAADANTAIKDTAADASQKVKTLRDELESAAKGGTGSGAMAKATADAVAKSHEAWDKTRKAVQGKLDTLQGKMAEAYKDHGFGADLEKHFKSKLEPMTAQFDESLNHVLAELGKATDPTKKKALIAEAESVRKRYETYLAGEKQFIQKLDENPFVPNLGIGTLLNASLSTIGKTLESLSNSVG